MILRNGKNPTGAIIATVRSVVDAFGEEVHKQKCFKPTRQLFRWNYAQYLGFDSVRPQNNALVNGSDHFLSKRIVELLSRIGIVEINRGIINNPVHIAIMNSEHAFLS